METLNLLSIPGYAWNEIAERRDNILVKCAANGKTALYYLYLNMKCYSFTAKCSLSNPP
jgi:hypothetical protein